MSDSETGKKPAKQAHCRVCGAPFAKAKQIEFVVKKVNLAQEIAETCPACRRKEFLRQTEEKLVGESAAAER